MRKLDFKSLTMFIVALALMVMTNVAKPAYAEDDPFGVLNKIKAAGVLKAPVMVGEEPGYIKDPATGEWSGFYVEWAGEIADLLGVKVEPVETTWGNLAADFQAGKIDLAIGLNPNPKRGLVVDYLTVPLFTDAWALSVPTGSTIKTWAELNDPKMRLVVQKGSTMQVIAEALAPKAQITPVEDRNLAVLELKSGRADAIVLAVFDALQVKKEGIGDIVLPEPILRNPATIGVARVAGNSGYINFLTNWVQQQRALGLAQGKLAKAWEKAGIDLSALPPGFSF
jgi:polar amino acid transport system substrate-binding protein